MRIPPTPPPLPLSDQLALERTRLANERTMLAYLRTGLALVIAGFSLFNFFRETIYHWVGVLCVPLGVAVIALGWMRFRSVARHISKALAPPG